MKEGMKKERSGRRNEVEIEEAEREVKGVKLVLKKVERSERMSVMKPSNNCLMHHAPVCRSLHLSLICRSLTRFLFHPSTLLLQ